MATRSYSQNCSIATFLDSLGGRWSLLIIRDLMIGPRRFTQLLDSLTSIGPNLLTQRLSELQELGLVKKLEGPEDGPAGAYSLTDSGRALEPILLAIVRWSLANLEPREPPKHNLDEWLVVAFKACFQAPKGHTGNEQFEFRIGEVIFTMTVEGEQIDTRLGHADRPAFTFVSGSQDFGRLVSGELDVAEAEAAKLIYVMGDRHAYERWLSMSVL